MTEGSIILSASLAAALALLLTGIWLLRQPGGNRVKAWLMVAAALVIGFNGWLLSLPPPLPPQAGTAAPA